MMKVMIISDTHSHEENLEKILQEEGMPDHLIHLGDSEKGEHAIRNLVTCPLHMVAGNGQHTVAALEQETLERGNGAFRCDRAGGGIDGVLKKELFAGKFHIAIPFLKKE